MGSKRNLLHLLATYLVPSAVAIDDFTEVVKMFCRHYMIDLKYALKLIDLLIKILPIFVLLITLWTDEKPIFDLITSWSRLLY